MSTRCGLFQSEKKVISYKRSKLAIPSTDVINICHTEDDEEDDRVTIPYSDHPDTICDHGDMDIDSIQTGYDTTEYHDTPTSSDHLHHHDNVTNCTFDEAFQIHAKSYKNIYDWTVSEGEEDFLSNFHQAIQNNSIAKGNIVFLLFSELVRYLANPPVFKYSDKTLLWYMAGLKQFGARWLRSMRGLQLTF